MKCRPSLFVSSVCETGSCFVHGFVVWMFQTQTHLELISVMKTFRWCEVWRTDPVPRAGLSPAEQRQMRVKDSGERTTPSAIHCLIGQSESDCDRSRSL